MHTDRRRYGDDKGACENIFSYGFLEDSTTSAKVMFLDLEIPDDDPLRPAKAFVSTAAPGFRIFDKDNGVDWESDYIWLVIVNEEDGLDFKLRQTIDGKREIQAFWRERELDDTVNIRQYLQEDPAWDVFQLRATVLLQNRVDAQIEAIQAVQGTRQEASMRAAPWKLAERLRSLELDMLTRAGSLLESQVRTLLALRALHFRGPHARDHYSTVRSPYAQACWWSIFIDVHVGRYLAYQPANIRLTMQMADFETSASLLTLTPADLCKQKSSLLETKTVLQYLGMGEEDEEEVDFS
jgi:hypothetical protein